VQQEDPGGQAGQIGNQALVELPAALAGPVVAREQHPGRGLIQVFQRLAGGAHQGRRALRAGDFCAADAQEVPVEPRITLGQGQRLERGGPADEQHGLTRCRSSGFRATARRRGPA